MCIHARKKTIIKYQLFLSKVKGQGLGAHKSKKYVRTLYVEVVVIFSKYVTERSQTL